MIDAYVAGVNAWIAHAQQPDRSTDLDANYPLATLSTPTPWTPGDVVTVAGLIGGIFGKGGGDESPTPRSTSTSARSAPRPAPRPSPSSRSRTTRAHRPPSSTSRFPYEIASTREPVLTAIPDHPRAAAEGRPDRHDPGLQPHRRQPDRTCRHRVARGHAQQHMSNALVVDAKDTQGPPPDRGLRAAGVLLLAADPVPRRRSARPATTPKAHRSPAPASWSSAEARTTPGRRPPPAAT